MNTLRRTRPAAFDGLIVAIVLVFVLGLSLGAVLGLVFS